jgi:ferredoxin
MIFKTIDKSELPALVRAFMSAHQVIGPVRLADDHFALRRIEDPGELALEYTTTVLSAKGSLLPHTEAMMAWQGAQTTPWPSEPAVVPQVLFGIHACDVNAINRLDAVFIKDGFTDPYYQARRNATKVVGISCVPAQSCLCGLWGTGEVYSGYDLFLHDIGDSYLVSVLTVTGAETLEGATEARPATAEEILAFEIRAEKHRAIIKGPVETSHLPLLMELLHDDATWDDLGQRCLSCTACSVVCPTCYCFDINDASRPRGGEGVRERVWDSCNSPAFAKTAGGHDFRGAARSRVRHRFYHKLFSHLAKHGAQLCVGCGRCVRECKAHINPRTVIEGLYRERDKALALEQLATPVTPLATGAPIASGASLATGAPLATGRSPEIAGG